MKLSTYLGLTDTDPYDFHVFRRKLVSWGLQVNYDEAQPIYVIKQKTEDAKCRKALNEAIKNGAPKKILELNGILVDKGTDEIVCVGYETTREVRKPIEILQERKVIDLKTPITEEQAWGMMPKYIGTFPYVTHVDLDKLTMDDVAMMQKMVDGVMIRIYYHDDTWHIGTGRAIDAGKSVWSSNKSFLDMFFDAGRWNDIMASENLNTRHSYSFILCHPDNQQVVKHKYVQLYHVLSRNMDTLEEINVDLGINKLPVYDRDTFASINEALNTMKNSKDSNNGVMIVLKNGMRIPVMSDEYHAVTYLRGKHANLRCRAIEIVLKNNEEMENAFCSNFPTFAPYIRGIKKEMENQSNVLFSKIKHKYIDKNRFQENYLGAREKHVIRDIWTQFMRAKEADIDRINKLKREWTTKKATANKVEIVHFNPETAEPADGTVVEETIKTRPVLNAEPGVRTYIRPSEVKEEDPFKMKPMRLTPEFVKRGLMQQPADFFWELLNERPDKGHEEDWQA